MHIENVKLRKQKDNYVYIHTNFEMIAMELVQHSQFIDRVLPFGPLLVT